MRRSILVIGGNGFVGSHICRSLIDAGHRVSSFGLPMQVDLLADVRERMRHIDGSVEAIAEIDAAIAASAPDTLVWSVGHNANAAGLMATGESDPARALGVNAGGLFNALHAAHRARVQRVMIAGSLVVLGPAECYATQPVDESAAVRPTTTYGLSKALGEQIAQHFRDRYAMQILTFRLAVVFGQGRWYGGVVAAFSRILAEAAPGRRARLEAPAEAFDIVHVKDVAQAMRLAIESDQRLAPVYHVNGFTATYAQLIQEIETQVAGYKVELVSVPAALCYPLVKFALLQRDLGYAPAFDLRRTIADCLPSRGGSDPA